MQLVELLIRDIDENESSKIHTELASKLQTKTILFGPPNREAVDGYVLGGVYDKSAWRFLYDESKYGDKLEKLLFSYRLKYDDVEFRVIYDNANLI